MKKNIIVVIGCSWCRNSTGSDYPFVMNHTLSWPELLALDLGKDYKVLNYSMHGASNSFILHLTHTLCNNLQNSAAVFVLQFTRALRQFFVQQGHDTFSNLADINRLKRSSHHCVQEQSEYLELMSPNGTDIWKFNEAGLCNAWPGKLQLQGSWLRTLYQNNLLYAGEHQKISDVIVEAIMRQAKRQVERAGIPVVAYSHTDFQEADLDFLDFVAHRDFIEMENYVVDTGLHLNTEGHRLLLDNFIKPCIDTKI